MPYGPATTSYVAALVARDWLFLPQLPGNTALGPLVAGVAGARSEWSPTGSRYEVAPLPVQREMGILAADFQLQLEDAAHPIKATVREVGLAVDRGVTPIVERLGLDNGVLGFLAKSMGIPLSVLILAVLFIAWGVLRQYRIVPPITQVIK